MAFGDEDPRLAGLRKRLSALGAPQTPDPRLSALRRRLEAAAGSVIPTAPLRTDLIDQPADVTSVRPRGLEPAPPAASPIISPRVTPELKPAAPFRTDLIDQPRDVTSVARPHEDARTGLLETAKNLFVANLYPGGIDKPLEERAFRLMEPNVAGDRAGPAVLGAAAAAGKLGKEAAYMATLGPLADALHVRLAGAIGPQIHALPLVARLADAIVEHSGVSRELAGKVAGKVAGGLESAVSGTGKAATFGVLHDVAEDEPITPEHVAAYGSAGTVLGGLFGALGAKGASLAKTVATTGDITRLTSDPYAILGLSRDATPAQVEAAFKERALRYHPDRSREPHTEEIFKTFAAARDAILNERGMGAPQPAREPEPTSPVEPQVSQQPTPAGPTPAGPTSAGPSLRRRVADFIDPTRQAESEQAFRDPMTGLANQAAFEHARPRIDADPESEVISVDVGNLKALNDLVGRGAGDARLAEVGRVLAQIADQAGIPTRNVFRAGGDEFAIAVPRGMGEQLGRALEAAVPHQPVRGTEYVSRVRYGVAPTFAEADAVAQAKKAQEGARYRNLKPEGGQSAVREVPVSEIGVDPERFQFKQDVGQAGVGRKLQSIQKYDPNLAGVVQVWTDPRNGRTYVINGHHRLELAARTGTPSILARFIEAKDAPEARTIGALTNIAEGRGTPVDAAKLFKDAGLTPADLQARGISLSGAVARDGLAIANLQDSLFRDVATGRLPVSRAAVIGRSGLSGEQQLALVDLLNRQETRGKRLNNAEVEELVRFVRSAGGTQATQDSLFGEETLTRSNAIEKAELAAWAKGQLARDRRLFGFLTRGERAERIEGTGAGRIDTEKAGGLAESSAHAEELFNRLVTRAGPISESLNRAAQALAGGADGQAVRQRLLSEIRGALEGLGGEGAHSEGAEGRAGGQGALLQEPRPGRLRGLQPPEAVRRLRGPGQAFEPDRPLEVQQGLFGGAEKVGGNEQRALFGEETKPQGVTAAEAQARATAERLGPLVEAGRATPDQARTYRLALALLNRDRPIGPNELRARSQEEGPETQADENTGDLFPDLRDPGVIPPVYDPVRNPNAPVPQMRPIGGRLHGQLTTGAIQPGKPINQPQVIALLTKVLRAAGSDIPIRFGRVEAKRARGVFKVGPEVIRIARANNIATAAHELGHALEKVVFGFPDGGPWVEPIVSSAMQKELAALGRALYGNTRPAGGYKREGFAEYMRLWLTTDGDAQAAAPEFTKFFEGGLLADMPKIGRAMEEARDGAKRWRMQGAQQRARASMIDTASPTKQAKRGLKKVRDLATMEKWVDIAYPLKEVSEHARRLKGMPLKASDDPFVTISALRTTQDARVAFMVERGMIDFNGNPVGPSLEEAAALVKGRGEEFALYLWALRAKALWEDVGVNLDASMSEKDRAQAQAAQRSLIRSRMEGNEEGGRHPGLSYADALQLIEELDSPEFGLAADKVYAWQDGVLNYASQASPTFARVVGAVRQRDPGNYVPLSRTFEELDATWERMRKGGPTMRSPVKRLKGSGANVKDIFQTIISNASRTVAAAHKRRVLDQVIRLSRIEGLGYLIEEVKPDEVPVARVSLEELIHRINQQLVSSGQGFLTVEKTDEDLDLAGQALTFFGLAQQPPSGEPIVPIVDKGKIRWFYLDQKFFDALSSIDVYRLPEVAGIPVLDWMLGKPTRLFRAGTTGLRASFGLIWNMIRDPQTLWVNSRSHANGAKLMATWVRSMAEAGFYATTGKASKNVEAFLRLGGQMAQPLGQDVAHTRRAARRLFAGRVVRTLDPRNWYDFYRDLVQFPEMAPRITELQLVGRELGWEPGQNMNEEQALQLLLAARQVTTDFGAAGEFARAMNQAVPFFNAGIQGPRANVRAAMDHPSRFVLRGLQLTALTLALWWKCKDEDWYRELEYREKAMNWHMPFTNPFTGKEELLRMPRSFEVGLIFSSMPEAFMDGWYRQDPEEAKSFMSMMLSVTNPAGYPVLMEEMLEQAGNKDSFWKTPIVPQSEIRRPAEEQFNEYTSRAAITLGQMFGVSPRRIDHAIDGVFGPLGGDLLSALGLGAAEVVREKELADAPVVGRLFQRGGLEGNRSLAVTELYDVLEQAQRRQYSTREPETPEQRQIRLQLSDAADAVSALMYVRKYVPAAANREVLTHQAGEIARAAVELSKRGGISRPTFQQERQRAERLEEQVKGLVGPKPPVRRLQGLPR